MERLDTSKMEPRYDESKNEEYIELLCKKLDRAAEDIILEVMQKHLLTPDSLLEDIYGKALLKCYKLLIEKEKWSLSQDTVLDKLRHKVSEKFLQEATSDLNELEELLYEDIGIIEKSP